jgi:hypothetical protein
LGAWGTRIFDNDTAADFGHTIAEGGGLAAVEAALDSVLGSKSEYLESSTAEEALAAADTVARIMGGGSGPSAYTEALDDWIRKNRPTVSDALMTKARSAIRRVLSEPSELLEVWQESDEFSAWKSSVETLLRQLG